MKLLVDGSIHAGQAGGIQLYTERLLAELKNYCNITIATSVPERFNGLVHDVVPIPDWTQRPRGRVFWELTGLPRICRSGFDALFCVTPIAPPSVRLPVISVFHDATPLILHKEFRSATKALLWFSLQTLRMATTVIADSHSSRSDAILMGISRPNRTHVVYPGIENEPDSTGSSVGKQLRPYLLYVGSHKPNKNLLRLITAFGRLRSSRNLRLVLAGWDEERYVTMTEQAIARSGMADRVVIVKQRLSRAEVSSLFRSAAGFVLPSLYEGFGMPLAEALAHGVPSAASLTSSLPEVGGDAAIYFNPTSVRDMSEKMQRLLEDNHLRQRLAEMGPKQASRFSWRAAAQAVFQLLLAAVNQ